ncbi:MAG: hypothetical protein HY279_11385, partial [Nitrospinae bacterium]|nr:hypothetical protein [Nitrospinota bacterium]
LPTYHGKIKVIKPKGNNFEVMNGKIEELYRAALETKTSELLDKLKEMIPDYRPWTELSC